MASGFWPSTAYGGVAPRFKSGAKLWPELQPDAIYQQVAEDALHWYFYTPNCKHHRWTKRFYRDNPLLFAINAPIRARRHHRPSNYQIPFYAYKLRQWQIDQIVQCVRDIFAGLWEKPNADRPYCQQCAIARWRQTRFARYQRHWFETNGPSERDDIVAGFNNLRIQSDDICRGMAAPPRQE